MKTRLGKYTLREKIGGGSMGAVYAAYDEVLERHVAIKTIAAQRGRDPELQLRFYREAKSAARLQHPNIVGVYDMGEEGETAYIAMELLEGKDLKKIIEEKTPMALERKLSIIAQVAEGMAHAHDNGILHRDLKPGNIHVGASGNAKILDFGIAHIPASNLTESGVRLGTPLYMSPEQIRGLKCDARSDIFSLGIVMYELLTYTHPFREKTLQKTLDRILFGEPCDFGRHLPDAPAGLWPVVGLALVKDPGRRYAAMADLGGACRALLRDPQRPAEPLREGRPARLSTPAAQAEATAAMPVQRSSGPALAPPPTPSASGEVGRLVGLGRQALGSNDFARAERFAQQALQLDGGSAPRSLLDQIEAQRKKFIDDCVAGGMAARPPRINAGSVPPPEPPPGLESTVLLPRTSLHPALRLGVPVALLLALGVTALVVLSRPDTARRALEAAVTQAKSELDRGQLDKAAEIARRVLGSYPENPQARKILDEADGQSSRRKVEVLLLEAQSLRAQRKFPESDAKLRRVLEVDPANAAALSIRSQLAGQRSGPARRLDPAAPIQVAESAALRPVAVELPRAELGIGSAYLEVPDDAFDGCEIVLDGTRLDGPYPARIPQLAAGDHRVVFRWSSGKYAGRELSSTVSIAEHQHVVARAEPESRTVTVQQVR